MTKRIHWKKGMRLTEDILRKSDECVMNVVNKCFSLATSGGFGLLPTNGMNQFEVTLDVNRSFVEIYSLRCLAITKGGILLDIDIDATSTKRVEITCDEETNELLLIAQAISGPWQETGDNMEETPLGFSLIPSNMQITSDRVMPVAKLVRDNQGWRPDENFIPPLLFVSSHQLMEELRMKFQSLLRSIDQEARTKVGSEGGVAISIFWPIVQQLLIATEMEKERMHPSQLLGYVERFVSAFVCATDVDENLYLADADRYRSYIYTPYSYTNVYTKVREGLQLCYEIQNKVENFNDKPEPKEEELSVPFIHERNMVVKCRTSNTQIPISGVEDGAAVYFTTNGRRPTYQSSQAEREADGSYFIKFQNDFQEKGKEPDKLVTISMFASKNGKTSEVGVYEVTLKKSPDFVVITVIKKKDFKYEF